MGFLHLRPGDYLAMPWKDGGGVTEQIAIEPPGATLAGGFLWRLSMARVERSGPFSRFEGYDRALLMLEGGLDLDFGTHGRICLDESSQPFAFSGDWEAHATLSRGPARDLGIISDRARVRQEVRVTALDAAPIEVLPASPAWIIALRGRCLLSRLALEFGPLESARLDGEGCELRGLTPGAKVLVVRFLPLIAVA